MDEQTRAEWEELKKSFDDRIEAANSEYVERVNNLEDYYRKRNEEREDRKYAFLNELKKEHRIEAAEYIKARREATKDFHVLNKILERERQAAYADFKSTHKWGGEEGTNNN